MQSFRILKPAEQEDNGIGGFKMLPLSLFRTVSGYLDMLQGTDQAVKQSALVEESTHVLVLPNYSDGIDLTDEMEVIDEAGKQYIITYTDDPVGARHHWEIYLMYKGVADGG